nr:MAG TPA: Cytosine specific methyltransferase [Caudoviricetes sp.]
MRNYGDITKISGYEVPPVDVVIGGSPCQDLSVAGLRKGLAGQRSGLFMDQIRIVKEMRENDRMHGRTGDDVRPRFMVWENVCGAFSSNGGKDFLAVLEETAHIADENAVIPEPPQGKWRNAGVIMGDGWSIAWRVHNAQFWGVPQRRRRISLVADFAGGRAPEVCFVRKSLSGHPEPRGKERKEAPGQTVPCADKTGRTVYGISSYESNHQNRVTDYTAIVLHESAGEYVENASIALRNSDYKHPPVTWWDGKDTVQTITANLANQRMPDKGSLNAFVDFRNGKESEINGTLQAKESGGSSVNYNNTVRENECVRNLTPLECERLQGFPDGWTDIGDWTDDKGKKHKTTDSNRYKALGNSIALPFWKYLLKRISAEYERDAAMASLFDGIGGFPYLWEQINGKGSCKWISEIEPFCCALTEKRFI